MVDQYRDCTGKIDHLDVVQPPGDGSKIDKKKKIPLCPKSIFPPSQFSSDSSEIENSGSEGKFRTFEVRFREVDNESDPKVKIFYFPA